MPDRQPIQGNAPRQAVDIHGFGRGVIAAQSAAVQIVRL